jgi:hypothetical protein
MTRSFVFFWETEPNKFIFESAGERVGHIGKNLTADEICRHRAFEGTKKVFNWHTKELFPIEITDWIFKHPEMFTQAKNPLTWAENSILRKVLNAKGYTSINEGGRTEKHQGDIYQAIRDIKEYLFGTPTARDFSPKEKTTKRLLNFIENKYNGLHTFNKVLYGATMGAGKTSDFLHACQQWNTLLDTNVHLCVTSMPDTRKDLCRDVADGIQFQNIIVVVPDKALPDVQFILKDKAIGFSDIQQVGIDPTKNYIISLGVQDARGNEGNKYREILEKLKFGMYGKDEVHTNQGEFSMFAKHVEQYLNYDLAIYLTGTPEKFVLEGSEFVAENTILFLSNDLYEAQLAGDIDWQGYPWRNFMVLDYRQAHDKICNQLGLTPDQGWTLAKQWAWDKDNDCLVHELSVTELIKIRFGVGLYVDDPRCFWGPGSGLAKYKRKTGCIQIENGDTDKKTVYVAKLIERITGIKSFSAHDKNGYDNWLNFCNNNPKVSSVYITHDKDMTGKNNKKINFQWLSLNIGSSTRIGQSIGRGNRKDEDKDNVYYFIDDPETALSVTLDPIEATSNTPGVTQTTAEKIHRISSFWFEGSERWKKATIPDLVALIQKLDPIGVRGLNSLHHINVQANCPVHLQGALSSVRTPKSVSGDISDIEGNKGKNSTPEESKKDFDIKDDNKLYRQNLQKSIRSLAKALIRTNGTYSDVQSILANPVMVVEGYEITLEAICKPTLSFVDLQAAFLNGDINASSVNKVLSVIKTKMDEASECITDHIDFLNHADLIDNDTKFITESVDLVTDYVYNTLSHVTAESISIGDLCAGRGAYLIEAIEQASKFNIIIDPKKIYYNDIDPISVYHFREINDKFGLKIPDINITCCNALTYREEYPTVEFDVGIGNPAFNIADKESGNGTGGNVNLYKQISDAYPIKTGGIKALITPKGILKHLASDTEFNTLSVNLMTEKNYWKYNTCWWITKKETNQQKINIVDRAISKVFQLGGNPNWYELNGEVNKNKINFAGSNAIKAIVNLPTKKTTVAYSMVDPAWEKIAYGPKFCATLFENKATYCVTDEPLCAKFSGAILTKTIEEADKIKLFIENSKLLPAINKKLKIKGLFWTMRHLKSFDPNQIVTGTEIPTEWNLTEDDLKYLGL